MRFDCTAAESGDEGKCFSVSVVLFFLFYFGAVFIVRCAVRMSKSAFLLRSTTVLTFFLLPLISLFLSLELALCPFYRCNLNAVWEESKNFTYQYLINVTDFS